MFLECVANLIERRKLFRVVVIYATLKGFDQIYASQ